MACRTPLLALLFLAGAWGEEDSCGPTQRPLGASLLQSGFKSSAVKINMPAANADISEDVVKELAYLAGGMVHSVTLLDTRGWVADTAIVDRTHEAEGHLDTAQIYRKGDSCAIMFSATDDPIDEDQQIAGSLHPVDFCGAAGVNGGYAHEMQAYMHTPEWQTGIAALHDCSTIYSAGHSMGGAMASLFAYCANTEAEFEYKAAFGNLPEVFLVTFDAPTPAQTPLYNGRPGQCFTGTRRFVSVTPAAPSKEFHVANLELFGQLAAALGHEEGARQLSGAAEAVSQLAYPSSEATAVLGEALPSIGPMWLLAYAVMSNTVIPGYEQLRPAYPQLQEKMVHFLQTNAMNLLYSYDPVPQLFAAMGFQHPLVKAEPMTHSVVGGQVTAGAECSAAANTPNEDYPKLFWGLLMANAGRSGLSFPNHGMCCLISDANCDEQFAGTHGITCTPSMFR